MHYEIRLDSGSTKVLQSSDRPLLEGGRFLTSLPPARAVWHEPAAPVVAPASAKEQAAQAEAHCRLAVYVAQENMSRKEANAFSERVANMMETMQNLYSTEGSLQNVALDHLGVMRYPECKEAEE